MSNHVLSNLTDDRHLVVSSRVCLPVTGNVWPEFRPHVEISAANLCDLATQPRVVLREPSRRHQQKEIVSLNLNTTLPQRQGFIQDNPQWTITSTAIYAKLFVMPKTGSRTPMSYCQIRDMNPGYTNPLKSHLFGATCSVRIAKMSMDWIHPWIGLDWVSKLVNCVGMDLEEWTHGHLCPIYPLNNNNNDDDDDEHTTVLSAI